ncbi:MAG: hypothetical protein HYU67_13920 [Flavobacteriia bacterium]|nr:hypothetical protein [Flavobacteriia bacterium]
MENKIEINQGEVRIKLNTPMSGKLTLSSLGLKNEDLYFQSGFVRLLIDLEGIGEHQYYSVPTVEIVYSENMSETHWQCEFNNVTILDKNDHHGFSTILLLDRKKISNLEHHHENKLIIHVEFPKEVQIDAEKSSIHLFN